VAAGVFGNSYLRHHWQEIINWLAQDKEKKHCSQNMSNDRNCFAAKNTANRQRGERVKSSIEKILDLVILGYTLRTEKHRR
jgi:hypothetical protein